MSKDIAVIPGDGVGPEVVKSAVKILKTLPVDLNFSEFPAGDATLKDLGAALPKETLQGAVKSDAVLLGAVGETAAEVIIALRQELDTYVNLRPIKAYPGVDCLQPATDLTIVRENTQCLYAGLESKITSGVSTATRVITKNASRRISQFAFEHARSEGRKLVSIVHKSNVLPVTEGEFLSAAKGVARDYEIKSDDVLVDAAALYLVKEPERFDVILTTNLFGDILSDLAAGLIGGLGLSPSANIGNEHGIFEPVHGTAPDIAGEGVVNPTATVLSAGYLLKFLDEDRLASQLEKAVEDTLAAGETTPDLGGELSTMEFTEAVLKNLE